MTSSPTTTGIPNAALRLEIRSCRSVQWVHPRPRACPAPVAASSQRNTAICLVSSHARMIHYRGQQHRASANLPNACLLLSTLHPRTSQLSGSPLRSASAPFPHRSTGETARWANGESSFYAHPFLSTFQLSDEAHWQGPPEMLVDHAFGMAPTHAWTILPSSA